MKKVSSKKSILILVVAILIVIMCILIFNAQKNKNTNPSGDNYIGDEYLDFEEESGDEWLETVNANIELSEKEVIGENIKVTVKLDNDENIYSVMTCPLYDGISELEEIEATKIDDGVYEAEINFEELNAEEGYYQFKAILEDYNGNEKEIISEDTVNYSKTGVSYAHAYQKEDGRTAVQITALDKGEVLVSTTNVAPTADDIRWTKYEAGEEYIIATPEENVENVYVWYKDGEKIINAADSGISVMSFEDATFIMEWTIPAGADGKDVNGKLQTIIKLPIKGTDGKNYNNYTVDWGDGTSDNYTAESFPEHIYTNTSDTVYEIKITGKLYGFGYCAETAGGLGNSTAYRPTKDNSHSNFYTFTKYLTSIKSWGELEMYYYGFAFCENLEAIASPEKETFTNVRNFGMCFEYCTKLKSIPADLFYSAVNVTKFSNTFYNCSGLSGEIPAELFANNTNVFSFSETFMKCSGLSGEIPAELFANNTNVTDFSGTFQGCSGLSGEIPAKLFASNTSVTDFSDTFYGCSGLNGKIPAELFANNTKVTWFRGTFELCSGLSGEIPANLFENNKSVINFSETFRYCRKLSGEIPAELFSNNTSVTDFSWMFDNCSGLSGEIPAKLFANNTSVSNFSKTFYNCSGLSGEIPAELFANNTSVSNFSETFYGCSGLSGEIPANLFANNTSATNFSETFCGCSGLTSSFININTENVISNYGMFAGCTNIKYLLLGDNFGKIQSSKNYAFASADTSIITLREEPIEYIKHSPYTTTCPATLYVKNATIEQKFEQADTDGMFGAARIKVILELIGDSTITVSIPNKYIDPGVKVAGYPSEDLKAYPGLGLTFEANTTAVDTAIANKKPGEYTVTYTLKYNGEVFATKTRKVIVTVPPNYKNDANVYFATLADAFNETASGGTITVLENVTDASNATLNAGKTITLNTNGKVVTKTVYGIENNGTLTIDGTGTIQTANADTNTITILIINNGTLNVKNGNLIHNGHKFGYWFVIADDSSSHTTRSTINISGGNILTTLSSEVTAVFNGRVIHLQNATLNMTGGIVRGNVDFTRVTRDSTIGIELNGENNFVPTANISGGTIDVPSGVGIFSDQGAEGKDVAVKINITGGNIYGSAYGICDGNITLGTKGNGVTETPVIAGGQYGLYISNGNENAFTFYDGILKGKASAFSGTVTEVEPGYGVHYDTDGDYKTAYLVKIPTLTVSPNPLSIVYGSTGTINYTYNGDGAITASSSKTGICTVAVDATAKKVIVSPVAVGSSVVTISAAETDSYKAISTTVNVTVTAATPGITLKEKTAVYTGNVINIDAATTTGVSSTDKPSGTITYTYYTDSTCTTKTPTSTGASAVGGAPKDAGTYYVKATIAKNGNYSENTSSAVTLTISKKSVAVTWGTTVSWVYDGKSHIPTTSISSGVTNETITLTVVTAQTNVGNYTATASLKSVTGGQAKTANYTLTSTSKDFSITAATPGITLKAKTATYSGSAISIDAATVTGVSATDKSSGGITYTYYTNSTCTTKTPTSTGASAVGGAPKDAGTYYVTATVATKGNYTANTSAAVTLTINPKSVAVSWKSPFTWVYDGKSHIPATSISSGITDETITLNVTGGATDVGEYTATAALKSVTGGQAKVANYTLTNTTQAFSITRANQTITLSDKTIDYNPNNVPVSIGNATVTGVNGTVLNVTVTYTYYTNSACTTQTTTADGAAGNGQAPAYAGVYYVVASVAQSQNYNATSKTVILTINKIANTLVITGVPNLRYIEAPQNLVTVSTPQGDVYYLIGNTALNSSNYTSGTTKNTIPQGTNAGTYVVQYYTPGNRNYKEKGGSVTVVIIDTYYKDNASPVKYYISLQEAFSQIETGRTLLVMKNVTDNNQATLAASKNIILELNGKTITVNKTGMTATFTFIVNNGTLTMQDSSSGKTGTINITGETTATDKEIRLMNNNGTVTIKSGKYNIQSSSTKWVVGICENNDNSVINVEGGSIVVTGTTDKNSNIYGINALKGTTNVKNTAVVEAKNTATKTEWVSGIYANGEGKSTVNITGGTIKGNTGIFFSATDTNAGGTLNISGTNTKIEGSLDGIRNIRATGGFTINGGTITGGRYGIYQTVNNNITTSGNINGGTNAGIRIDSGTCTINITGGNITSQGGEDTIHFLDKSNVTLNVTNATIASGSGSGSDAIDKDGGTGDITIDGNSVLTGTQSAIVNQGTGNVIIKNGTLTGNRIGISSENTGNITIEKGTLTGGNGYAISGSGGGNITIENGTITGKGTIPAVNVYKTGTLTIRGGSVISEGSSAVKSYDTAKIIVGTQGGGEPSKTNPLIQGKEYGVEAINGFNFYDGILKGKVDAFSGNVTPETNYIIYYGKELINNVQYKTAILIKDTIEIPTSGKPVIIEWTVPANLDGNGFTTTIKIPIPANAKAYKVDWGDSVVEFVDANVGFKEHLYKNTAEQTYTIKASGYIDTFGYYSEAVPTKDNVYKDYYDFTQYVTAIKDWGVIEAKRYGFSNCTKLNSTIPSLKKVSFKNITDISLLFNNCSGLDIELQKDLFSDCAQLQYFNSAFNGCSKLRGTLPRELFASNPDVRKVARIFKGCSSLVGADIEMDSNNLTTMDEMFSGCTNIKTIVFEEKFKDLVGIKMFEGCNNLKSVVMLYEYNG